jgi:hypothetical protein
MKRWFVALLIVVLASSTALSAEGKGKRRPGLKGAREGYGPQAVMMQLVRRYDANKNGRLDADEQRTLLTAADKNLDGRLSPEELLAAAQGEGQQRGKDGGKKKKEK